MFQKNTVKSLTSAFVCSIFVSVKLRKECNLLEMSVG